MSHYETLGISPDAASDEIRAAYRKAASRAHPDREGGSDEQMQRVNIAFEVLSDPERRANYDATGRDTIGPNLDQMARDALMALFQEAALQDSSNFLRQVREELAQHRHQFAQQRRELEARLLKLRDRREKVSVKEGDNLAHFVFDQQIQGLESALKHGEQASEVADRVAVLLEAYTCSEIETVAVHGHTWFVNTANTGTTGRSW